MHHEKIINELYLSCQCESFAILSAIYGGDKVTRQDVEIEQTKHVVITRAPFSDFCDKSSKCCLNFGMCVNSTKAITLVQIYMYIAL